MKDEYLCACGGKCDGVCKEKHLHRERLKGTPKEFDLCPVASKPRSKREK